MDYSVYENCIYVLNNGLFCENDPISVVEAGFCDAGRERNYGYVSRPHYFLFYVAEGYADFYGMPVTKGTAFFVNDWEKYCIFSKVPCKYCWIAFNGTQVKKILEECHISLANHAWKFSYTNECVAIIKKLIFETERNHNLHLLSGLFDILSYHAGNSDGLVPKTDVGRFVQQAKDFININYFREISVEMIAKRLNISHKYLCKIFKKSCGISPKAYLIATRLQKSEQLLRNQPLLAIETIAHLVGFNDALYFSRVFK